MHHLHGVDGVRHGAAQHVGKHSTRGFMWALATDGYVAARFANRQQLFVNFASGVHTGQPWWEEAVIHLGVW